jgi:carbohydrate diacid regulator
MSVLSSSNAEFLSQRVAELLCAPVVITDERNAVIASGHPEGTQVSLEQIAASNPDQQLHIPLQLDGHLGQVVVGAPTTGEVIPPRLAQAAVELLINETAVVERLQNQSEVKNKFIHDLLHGIFKDESAIMHQARFLGMDLNPPRVIILIDAADYVLSSNDSRRPSAEVQVQRQSQAVIDRVVAFFHLPNDTICAYIGEGEIAVLKASNTKNLVTWVDSDDTQEDTNSSWANLAALKRAGRALLTRLQSETGATINIGIGRFHPGLNGLSESYQDAKVALSLGRRFQGRNRLYCLDELGIAAFVGVPDEQTKIDLATHLLSPLDHEPEMLETLEAYFAENCSPSATVKRLSIHRNTLRYRLEKAASLIGLDPRQFDEAVVIRLSLFMRSLRATVDDQKDKHSAGGPSTG